MTRNARMGLMAILLAGSFGYGGAALAYTATPIERAELAKLSPALRKKVEARLVGGQTVQGVLDTMLLNNVSHDFASGKVVATDFQRGTLVVQNPDGQVKAFPFQTETLEVK